MSTVGTTDLPHKEDFPIRCKYMLRYFVGMTSKHQNMIHQSRKQKTIDKLTVTSSAENFEEVEVVHAHPVRRSGHILANSA